MINYWWVTRPKRKLNSVPDVLAVFAEKALDEVWNGQRESHLSLEDALESSGLKRHGDRRDQTGGGGRTYQAWLVSLGLLFTQKGTGQLRLTLAGEAIMNGASPVRILSQQILKYQFPSAFSIGRSVNVSQRFRVHPFWFLLKLLSDSRLRWLTQEEIAKIVIVEAESDSDACYENIVKRILEFRECGDRCLAADFFDQYKPSRGEVNPAHPFSHLDDTANTLLNWLEYTQLIHREHRRAVLLEDRQAEIEAITANPLPFISRPVEHEFFQRKYGLDPAHRKDTRSLNDSQIVTAAMIAEHRVKQAFISCSLKEPIGGIDGKLIDKIADMTGIRQETVQEVLQKNYPHGSIGAFMTSYFEMAFKGREECRDFEEATANILRSVFGFQSDWLGSAWSGKEVPDVLLTSREDGWQASVDTKAYSRYELPATQRDRMIHHYLPDIGQYGNRDLPTRFFTYIAGGFSPNIAAPLQKIVAETGINGSAMPVAHFIKMVEQHAEAPYSHEETAQIFSLNRTVELDDLMSRDLCMVAEHPRMY